MRHHKKGRVLGRVRKGRTALLRSLLVSLIEENGINTSEAKAKELRPVIEKLVTKSRNNTLATRRLILRRLPSGVAVDKLLEEIGPKYKGRSGGYTRIVKIGRRLSDGSKMARIEFV